VTSPVGQFQKRQGSESIIDVFRVEGHVSAGLMQDPKGPAYVRGIMRSSSCRSLHYRTEDVYGTAAIPPTYSSPLWC
jgi:hypothetical protein